MRNTWPRPPSLLWHGHTPTLSASSLLVQRESPATNSSSCKNSPLSFRLKNQFTFLRRMVPPQFSRHVNGFLRFFHPSIHSFPFPHMVNSPRIGNSPCHNLQDQTPCVFPLLRVPANDSPSSRNNCTAQILWLDSIWQPLLPTLRGGRFTQVRNG